MPLPSERPAVIVSSRAYNIAKPDLVMRAITSQHRPEPTQGEVWLSHWWEAGLLKSSVVKTVFDTLGQRPVIRQLSTFAAADQIALKQAIAEIIG
jgi:mRNA interferase MazF